MRARGQWEEQGREQWTIGSYAPTKRRSKQNRERERDRERDRERERERERVGKKTLFPRKTNMIMSEPRLVQVVGVKVALLYYKSLSPHHTPH